ncbi:OsmC family protein [Thalassolituus sp. LLYu03]|uniref:OsmC family protein n=1 Tax=Thalassolituus sp. LLYu03 TaxID=3421656 RepID=UPI003D2B6474
MSEHIIHTRWVKQGAFSHEGYEVRHELAFKPDVTIPAGGAGNEFGADPEQMLAAAVSSCHMQTFLALAAKKRLIVASYEDTAAAEIAQRDDGKFWVPVITLSPKAVFEGDKQPDEEAVRVMHEKAHQHCFIANSVASQVVVEPRF